MSPRNSCTRLYSSWAPWLLLRAAPGWAASASALSTLAVPGILQRRPTKQQLLWPQQWHLLHLQHHWCPLLRLQQHQQQLLALVQQLLELPRGL